jgi:two-component system response regulator HupR/HoxA
VFFAPDKEKTMIQKPVIGILDDDHSVVESFEGQFSDEFEVLTFTVPADALERIDDTVSAILVDERMPKIRGTELLKIFKERRPDVLRILLTAYADFDCLVRSINDAEIFHFFDKRLMARKGGDEYVRGVLRRAAEINRLRRENADLLRALDRENQNLRRQKVFLTSEGAKRFSDLGGASDSFQNIVKSARKLVNSSRSVLIRGQTGTGKELLARAIHYEGNRADQVFVPLNCATFNRDMIGSELFGYTAGSFTGALARDKKGYLAIADKGTLFLDEIGDMPLEVQAHLNRFLDSGELRPVGDNKGAPQHVDVRIIAATHQDLEAAMQAGRFREDLYFRLKTFELVIPPLRNRPEDIPVLARQLAAETCEAQGKRIVRISQSAVGRLKQYRFPGNVRELKALIERAIVLADEGTEELTLEHFTEGIFPSPQSDPDTMRGDLDHMIDGVKREKILEALRSAGGHRQNAAASLGMSRRWLAKLMRDLNIGWPET